VPRCCRFICSLPPRVALPYPGVKTACCFRADLEFSGFYRLALSLTQWSSTARRQVRVPQTSAHPCLSLSAGPDTFRDSSEARGRRAIARAREADTLRSSRLSRHTGRGSARSLSQIVMTHSWICANAAPKTGHGNDGTYVTLFRSCAKRSEKIRKCLSRFPRIFIGEVWGNSCWVYPETPTRSGGLRAAA
jgi:hypothetical protein